jgi:hypothetical protein
VDILGLLLPAALYARYGLAAHIPPEGRPVVFIGPHEHHANELPWRESIADVVTIPENEDGHICLATIEAALIEYAARLLKIGSFSAASNVTGIGSATRNVTSLLHATEACPSGTSPPPAPMSRSRRTCGPTVPTATCSTSGATHPMTDADILSGIREAGRDDPAWVAVALDGPCPPSAGVAAAFDVQFGVSFVPGELDAIATVPALIARLREELRKG